MNSQWGMRGLPNEKVTTHRIPTDHSPELHPARIACSVCLSVPRDLALVPTLALLPHSPHPVLSLLCHVALPGVWGDGGVALPSAGAEGISVPPKANSSSAGTTSSPPCPGKGPKSPPCWAVLATLPPAASTGHARLSHPGPRRLFP